ncbi:carbohydrate ABC transporter permease, partial [Rhizobium ruizarguesonis]
PCFATFAMFAFPNSLGEFLAALRFLSDQSKFTLPIVLVNVSLGIYGSIDWGARRAGIAGTRVPCIRLFRLWQ